MNYQDIKKQRAVEVKNGNHLGTRGAVHIVYDLVENIHSGHSDYSPITNLRNIDSNHMYLGECIHTGDKELHDNGDNLVDPEEVTQFYTDRLVSIHLTRKSAEEYIKRQSHNLSNMAYIYTHCEGYAQDDIEQLFDK